MNTTLTAPSLSAAWEPFLGQGTYIIAEAGVNHNGDMALAKQLVDAAKTAGANAVKFQYFDPKALTSQQAELAEYQQHNIGASNAPDSQQAMLSTLAFTLAQFQELKAYCDQQDITFLCTPFSVPCAQDLIEHFNLPVIKLSSGDLTSIPELRGMGQLGKPVIISTGMATLHEVHDAVAALRYTNPTLPVAIMHCVSAYPAPTNTTNLRAMDTLKNAFPDCPIGYSDHTLGLHVPVAAVALGAQIIEKHFTLDTAMPGPDHKASLTPAELNALVTQIREIEQALGDGIKQPQPVEQDCIAVARKSLVLTQDLPQGHVLTEGDLACKRPGTGVQPCHYDAMLGQTLTQTLGADTVLQPEHVSIEL